MLGLIVFAIISSIGLFWLWLFTRPIPESKKVVTRKVPTREDVEAYVETLQANRACCKDWSIRYGISEGMIQSLILISEFYNFIWEIDIREVELYLSFSS